MSTLVLYCTWDDEESDMLRALRPLLPATHHARTHDNAHSRSAAAAYALLHIALSRRCPECGTPSFIRGKNGKPILNMAHPTFHFNLSHTTGLSLCALSDAPVGIDGERIRPVTAKTARRLSLPRTPYAFFQQWVRRESIIKLRAGSALQCRYEIDLRPHEHYFPLNVGKRHVAGLCTQESTTPEIHAIPLDLLCTFQSNNQRPVVNHFR